MVFVKTLPCSIGENRRHDSIGLESSLAQVRYSKGDINQHGVVSPYGIDPIQFWKVRSGIHRY